VAIGLAARRHCRERGRNLPGYGWLGVLVLAAGHVVACAAHQVPPPVVRCAAPCATVAEVVHPDYVRLHLHVPPATSLHNAKAGSAQEPSCGSAVPVAEVIVNGQHVLAGPAPLTVDNVIALRFPFTADAGQAALDVAAPHVVDLELRGPSGPSCLRIPLPVESGWLGFAKTLSFRPEPRP
jgi:hypothetical protein